MQADRRRLNAPAGGTAPPIFASLPTDTIKRPIRMRRPDEHRKIFLRTGIVPSASGSAYYEVPPEKTRQATNAILPDSSSLKITCTVHGPRPLPRNAAFSPNLLLSTHVKFAPFATRIRRGYVRDASERDLGVHLETALRGVIIADRWPKSGCEVVITVLEGVEDGWWPNVAAGRSGIGWGMMGVLAGCITVASAALIDAGIDCVDLVSGGVAAVVQRVKDGQDDRIETAEGDAATDMVLDPSPSEHEIRAACVVGYLQSRDEITQVWMKGEAGADIERLMDEAVKAAVMTRTVLAEAVKDAAELKTVTKVEDGNGSALLKGDVKDGVMTG